MPRLYAPIIGLLEDNLQRYEADPQAYAPLAESIEKFKQSGFAESDFEDEKSVLALNTVLQKFLNADTREISVKAAEGRSAKAADYEEILNGFGLNQKFPLPNPENKTIAIFGATIGRMRLRAKWISGQLAEEYPDSPKPQIVFLTGDRAAFLHVPEERKVLLDDIATKVANQHDPEKLINLAVGEVEKILAEAIAEGRLQKVDSPKLKQAITPLVIMREVNKLVPSSYNLEALETVDLKDFGQATEVLKMALVSGIYPSETGLAAVVAREELGFGSEALLPSDQFGKGYRANTRDNVEALLTKIQDGKLSPEVIFISDQPFCSRQLNDAVNVAEDPKWGGIKGLNFLVAGSEQTDKRVNPASTLDVFARDVYAKNQLLQSRAKREALVDKVIYQIPSPAISAAAAGILDQSASLGAAATP